MKNENFKLVRPTIARTAAEGNWARMTSPKEQATKPADKRIVQQDKIYLLRKKRKAAA